MYLCPVTLLANLLVSTNASDFRGKPVICCSCLNHAVIVGSPVVRSRRSKCQSCWTVQWTYNNDNCYNV